jgi:aspartyl-tRNA(Asn)/glutamyl-tRNA(Gln) amidotransferase subunit A
MASHNEICQMTAVELAARVRKKEISPVEVADASIERMEKLDPVLHAYCTPTPDLMRKQAKAVEQKIIKGEKVGPTAGVPVGIKDLVVMKDYPTVSGSMAYKDYISDDDDIVVERLKASDSLILGKTNVPEFGYSGVGHNPVFETTRNPWNTDLTPGGSSAGSVVSTITGMTPYAIASDGGGSIRIPSSLTGTYGLKASMGRVPLWPGTKDETCPGVSSWEDVEHIGPVSRTVEDAALMMSIIGSGPDPRDRRTVPGPEFDWLECIKGDIKGSKIAFSPDWGYAAVDPQVRDVVAAAVKVFESDLGCTVEVAHPGWENPGAAFWPVVMAGSDLTGLRKMVEQRGHEMTTHLVDLIMHPWTAEDFTDAQMTRKLVCNKMWRFMENYDFLLTPTLAVSAFPVHMQGPEKIDNKIGGLFDWLAFTFPLNFTGQPAASIPAGFTEDGLPVGLQIIGKHLDDPMVLRASAAFEAAKPWQDAKPPILAEMGL